MIIPPKSLNKWKALRSPEDTTVMTERNPGTYPVLYQRAFSSGKCNDEVFAIMAAYYAEKEQKMKAVLSGRGVTPQT